MRQSLTRANSIVFQPAQELRQLSKFPHVYCTGVLYTFNYQYFHKTAQIINYLSKIILPIINQVIYDRIFLLLFLIVHHVIRLSPAILSPTCRDIQSYVEANGV